MRDAPQLSKRLVDHVEELPFVRRSILDGVRAFADGLPAGARVLDAGAGDAPYAELFRDVEYVTADWPNSVHPGARRADIVASLAALPVPDASFQAVLCTEVLEHVARPDRVLAELARILVPGGALCATVPFVWPLHEEPFDYFRYTPAALTELLQAAGFDDVVVVPRSGLLTTLAQIADLVRGLYPTDPRWLRAIGVRVGLAVVRAYLRPLIWLVARRPSVERRVTGVALPLGYAVRASKRLADRD